MTTVAVTLDASAIAALATKLERAAQQGDDALRNEVRLGTAAILNLLRSRQGSYGNPAALIHEVTGEMARSLVLQGPFPIGRGSFEGRIVATVPYAAEEIAKGGSHDWPARTVNVVEGEGIGADIAARIEAAIVEVLAR